MTSLGAAQVIAPTSRAEAVDAFGDGAGVTVLGGGTILMPELNYGRLRPERVLLLQRAGLAGIAAQRNLLDDRRHDDCGGARAGARAARDRRTQRRRPRDPRPGDDRRQSVRAGRRREHRAATCRRR